MSLPLRRQYSAYCKAWGDAAVERGRANENRLLAAVLSLRASSAWILDARAATPEEDARGADVVVAADVGALYLQSKSSRAGVRKFVSKGRELRVEAVVVSLDDATTATRALLALSALRAELQRRARPVVVSVPVKQSAARTSVAKVVPRSVTPAAPTQALTPRALRRLAHKARHPNDKPHTSPPPLPPKEQALRAMARKLGRYALGHRCPLCENIVGAPTSWTRKDDGSWLCAECADAMERDWQSLGRPVSARAAGRLLAIVGGG